MGLTWVCCLILASIVLTEDDPLSSIVKLRVSQCHRPESALELGRIVCFTHRRIESGSWLYGYYNRTTEVEQNPVIEIHRAIKSVQMRRTAPQPRNVKPS